MKFTTKLLCALLCLAMLFGVIGSKLDALSEWVRLNYDVAIGLCFLVKVFNTVGYQLDKSCDIVLAYAVDEIIVVVFGEAKLNTEDYIYLAFCRVERLAVVRKIIVNALTTVSGSQVVRQHQRADTCRGVDLNDLLGGKITARAYGKGMSVKLGRVGIVFKYL